MYNKNPRTLQKTSLASFESKTTTGAAAGAGAGFCGNKSTRSNLHNNSDNAISAGSRVDSPMNRRAASPPGLKSPALIREAITNNSNTSVNSSNVGGTKLANRTNGIGSNSMNRSINSSSEATMMAPKAGSGMASTDQIVKIGDMVYIEGVNEVGTLKYLGPIADKNGVWAGIELDTPFAGKNNGNFNGVSYFSCTEQRGIFTSPAKLRVIPSVNTNTGVNGKTKNRNNSTVSNGSNHDTQSHNRNHRQSISSVGSPKVMNSKGTARPLGEYESIDSVLNPKQRLAIAPTLSNQQQNSKKQRNQKSQPQPPAQQKVPVSRTQSSNNSIDSNRSGALISERSTGQKSIGTRTKLREMVESRRKTLEPSAHSNTTKSKTTVVSPPTRAVKNSSAHHIQNGSKSGSISSGSGEGRSLQAAAGSSSFSKPIHDTRVELLEAENRVLRLENQQYKARITAGQWLATDMFEKENAIEASQSSSQSQIQDSTASENVSPNNKVANSSNSSTNSTVMRQLEQQLAEEREQNALLMAELENYKLLATNISSSNNINGSSSVLSNLNLNLNFNNDNENINNESELEQELARTREMLSDATIQAEIREHALLESQEACRVMEDKLVMFRDDTDALKRKIDVTQENLRSMLRRLSAFNSTNFTSVNNDNNEAIGDGERNDNVGNGMELANSWLQDTLIETIDADDSEMLFEYIDSALKTIKQKIDSANNIIATSVNTTAVESSNQDSKRDENQHGKENEKNEKEDVGGDYEEEEGEEEIEEGDEDEDEGEEVTLSEQLAQYISELELKISLLLSDIQQITAEKNSLANELHTTNHTNQDVRSISKSAPNLASNTTNPSNDSSFDNHLHKSMTLSPQLQSQSQPAKHADLGLDLDFDGNTDDRHKNDNPKQNDTMVPSETVKELQITNNILQQTVDDLQVKIKQLENQIKNSNSNSNNNNNNNNNNSNNNNNNKKDSDEGSKMLVDKLRAEIEDLESIIEDKVFANSELEERVQLLERRLSAISSSPSSNNYNIHDDVVIDRKTALTKSTLSDINEYIHRQSQQSNSLPLDFGLNRVSSTPSATNNINTDTDTDTDPSALALKSKSFAGSNSNSFAVRSCELCGSPNHSIEDCSQLLT